MAWPFQRANALGFAMFENFTSAQATIIDANAAAAADGAIWSDIALASSLLPKEIVDADAAYLFGQALFWEPVAKIWINAGVTTAGRSKARYSYANGIWFETTLESDTTAVTTWINASSAATDGNNNSVVGGRASNTKRFRSYNGTTWTAADSVVTGDVTVAALVWAPSASLFIAGMGNGASTNIETSFLGVAWTQRTAPNSDIRLEAAASPSRIVVIPNANSNKFITSEDGITWTERTVSITATWKSITWNAERGLFMALGGDSIVTSPDGITWTTKSTTATDDSSVVSRVRSIGRMWLRMNDSGLLRVSVDDGVNWRIISAVSLAGVTKYAIEAVGKQLMLVADDGAYRSLAGGV